MASMENLVEGMGRILARPVVFATVGAGSAGAFDAPDVRFMKEKRQNRTVDGRFGTDSLSGYCSY